LVFYDKDSSTVLEVLQDLQERFAVRGVVFVDDRGLVSENNVTQILAQGHGYLVGMRRRRNPELNGWLEQLRENGWLDCPVGVIAAEQRRPPRTRGQEVASGNPGQRACVMGAGVEPPAWRPPLPLGTAGGGIHLTLDRCAMQVPGNDRHTFEFAYG
jgi:hypothetical protein